MEQEDWISDRHKTLMVAEDEYIEVYDPELAHIQITIMATEVGKALEYALLAA